MLDGNLNKILSNFISIVLVHVNYKLSNEIILIGDHGILNETNYEIIWLYKIWKQNNYSVVPNWEVIVLWSLKYREKIVLEQYRFLNISALDR